MDRRRPVDRLVLEGEAAVTARLLVGDVHDRLTDIPDASVDLVLTSPPFLALRSYLPDGHPDKAKEIGSEPTPAEYLDVLLQLTAELDRVLAPHGSIAFELGDTYAGSGGAGGDYSEDGLREGQQIWSGSAAKRRANGVGDDYRPTRSGRPADDWPLPKSLACIPQLYQVALAYGINPLTGQPSPAGRWRIRTLKPWIRSNPPVGALGDKERPATSYVIVACRASDRYFDLDAVRTTSSSPLTNRRTAVGVNARPNSHKSADDDRTGGNRSTLAITDEGPAGAPPRDWWHHVDAILDTELAARPAGLPNGSHTAGPRSTRGLSDPVNITTGAQGVHLRRALERAGILTTLEALDVSPKGYSGAHYAVWPPELVRLLVDEMCPRRVCTTCGEPSRRLTETVLVTDAGQPTEQALTYMAGWSDCGHGTWRPGHVLDPFAGSGTTLAVCTGMARDATGIDIDERNIDLAYERVGMFLEIDQQEAR